MTNSPVDGADPFESFGSAPYVYILPEYKTAFVAVAKNGCTALKWMIAEVAGENPEQFRAGLRPRKHPVHIRSLWRHARRADQVPGTLRSQIRPDNGWFVFGVTRDPWSRFFSAWQDKFLLQDPAYHAWHKQPWYPPPPGSAEDISQWFSRFTDSLLDDPEHRMLRDGHFAPQVQRLRPDTVQYTRLYAIEHINRLVADLQAHLAGHGYDRPLSVRRFNDTPLKANLQVYSESTRQAVEKIYADDFAAFGDRWSFAKIATEPAWPAEVLREAQLRAEFNVRVTEIHQAVRQEQKRYERAAERARLLEKEVRRLRRELGLSGGLPAELRSTEPAAGPRAQVRRVVRRGRRLSRSALGVLRSTRPRLSHRTSAC
jgi:hypothetical protein